MKIQDLLQCINIAFYITNMCFLWHDWLVLKISHLCALLIAYETPLVALHFGSISPLSVFPYRFIQDFKNHIWWHLILRRVLFWLIQYTHAILS